MRSLIVNTRKFNNYMNKQFDVENVSKIPRDYKKMDYQFDDPSKVIESRNRDKRLSYKNRRTCNKDWKDFNNSYDEQ